MRRRSSPVPAAGVARPAAGGSPTAGLPAWLSLQLTQLVDMAPDGDQWLHEIKYDGYRMHARLDRGVNLWPTVRESEERLRYLRDLDERRAAILDSISQQGKTRLVAVPDAADVVWRH